MGIRQLIYGRSWWKTMIYSRLKDVDLWGEMERLFVLLEYIYVLIVFNVWVSIVYVTLTYANILENREASTSCYRDHCYLPNPQSIQTTIAYILTHLVNYLHAQLTTRYQHSPSHAAFKFRHRSGHSRSHCPHFCSLYLLAP
jgi:hypothetical protein